MGWKIQRYTRLPVECPKAVVWTAFDDEGCRRMGRGQCSWMLWNRVRSEMQHMGTSGTAEMSVEVSIVEIRDRMEIDVECFRVMIK